MRELTVIMAYYENPNMLKHQLLNFSSMSKEVCKNLTYIVVDDGSPRFPALQVFNDYVNYDDFHHELYRMKKDIPWNQDACRNLGMKRAPSDWVLLTDMDHVPPEKTICACMNRKLDSALFYNFARVSAPDMSPYKPHPNSYLMHQQIYFAAGGYDERWAGVYGTDGDFRSRLDKFSKCQFFGEPLIRYPREVIHDASTTQYERRSEENSALKDELGAKIRKEGGPPRTGLFEWEQQL